MAGGAEGVNLAPGLSTLVAARQLGVQAGLVFAAQGPEWTDYRDTCNGSSLRRP